MDKLIASLSKDFSELAFESGTTFSWSPQRRRIIYNPISKQRSAIWSLLHEVGHALLNHQAYESDFELLQLEVEAWAKASELATTYGRTIDQAHIERCLDTYRDWLHRRSTCPTCGLRSPQMTPRTYQCLNCHTGWQVSTSRFCRPYRRLAQTKKPPAAMQQATFS